MNTQSIILTVFGIFGSTVICSGQQPLCKKSMMRFAAEITRVDSILSGCSFYKQSISDPFLHSAGSDKDSLSVDFIHGKIKQKRLTIYPATVEKDRPKKI